MHANKNPIDQMAVAVSKRGGFTYVFCPQGHRIIVEDDFLAQIKDGAKMSYLCYRCAKWQEERRERNTPYRPRIYNIRNNEPLGYDEV